MGSVLVASLGKSPGAITTLVDALIERGEAIERVVPIYIKDTKRSSGDPIEIKELKKEFSDAGWYEGGITLDYENSWLPGKDIGEEEGYASLDDFYKKTLIIMYGIQKVEGKDLIIGIGGGRKGMSSIMAYTAITLCIEKVYQVIVSDDIEDIGFPGKYLRLGKREQALHPEKGQYWLVRLPSANDVEKIREEIRKAGGAAIERIKNGRITEHPTI